MACGSLRTNKTFWVCGRMTLGHMPIFQLGQQLPSLATQSLRSSPAQESHARGGCLSRLQAARGRGSVCACLPWE